MTVGKLMNNDHIMLHTSSQIDWLNCELAFPSSRSRTQASAHTVLLPHNPSLLDHLKKQDPDEIPSHLHHHPTLTVAAAGLTVTPIRTGQVTRRFPRRISPLTRALSSGRA
eukprot:TRINITY_DN9046_c0_g1_i1.p1 TRINITY_DN9046_c0_g1~~TRINITY_DN9046_c0_g1_i1.p1  ORF type:complete len:111 (+),score=27.74 TRINITY_DN9046_c0_g1_i1:173-505(+)